MGCDSSKAVDTASDYVQSPQGQQSLVSVGSAVVSNIVSPPQSQVEVTQTAMREKVNAVDERRRAADDPPAAAATAAAASNNNNNRNTQEEAHYQADEQRGQPPQQEHVDNARGHLSAQDKDAALNRIAHHNSSLGGSHTSPVGGVHASPILALDSSRSGANFGSMEGDSSRFGRSTTTSESEVVLSLRRERDALRADVRRVQGELDSTRTDLMYLRAVAEQSDDFQRFQKLMPGQWVASEQATISNLRRDLSKLDAENVLLKARLRRATYEESVAAADTLSPGHRRSIDNNDSNGVLASPTDIIERIHVLQGQRDAAQQEMQNFQTFCQERRQEADAEVAALNQHMERYRQAAAAERVAVEQLTSQRMSLEKDVIQLQSRLGETQGQLVETNTQLNAQQASLKAVQELQGDAERRLQELEGRVQGAEKAREAQQHALASSSSHFLKQISKLLVNVESCPEEVRMQLMQFVLEHSGLRVEGLPPIVQDPSTFDMNGVPYGDCLAFLASIVISRPDCRVCSVILCETQMTDLGCAQIALTFAALPFETSVACLNLSNNDISSRGALQLLTAIGSVGCDKIVRHDIEIDLDNNPVYRTVEDVQMLCTQIEHMKVTRPNVKVCLPRVPKLDQLQQSGGSMMLRSSSVFSGPAAAAAAGGVGTKM